MDSKPWLEDADLQLRAARFEYRQLLQQLNRQRLQADSAQRYAFAEECFHAAEKTMRASQTRLEPDDQQLLDGLFAGAFQARTAFEERLEWLSARLKLDPSLTGVAAVRWLYALPREGWRVAPVRRKFGLLDAVLIAGGLISLLFWVNPFR